MALLPRVFSARPLSYPIVYVACGAALMLLPLRFGSFDPLDQPDVTERVAELAVIVALTGAGLKLNRSAGLRRWATAWRLIGVTMPLTILAAAALGMWLLGLTPAAALLLGAVLAPTDPVLAADVQVEEPEIAGAAGDDHEVPFALTAEAGINDGLAFPFTNAAIAMAIAGSDPSNWIIEWVAVDVAYKIIAGVAIGYLLGRGLAHVIFKLPTKRPLAETSEGMVILSSTLLVYGVAELAHGYGFLAVFVAAVVLRDSERDHEYHRVLHGFSDQAERILSAVLLLGLGAAAAGGLLGEVGWDAIVCTALLLVVVRPVAGMVAQWGTKSPRHEKATISFFGIRGIGSIYYLAHGLNEAPFGEAEKLWSVVALVILTSIVLHGVTSGPWMKRIELDGQ